MSLSVTRISVYVSAQTAQMFVNDSLKIIIDDYFTV